MSTSRRQHLVAVALGCNKALVGTEWAMYVFHTFKDVKGSSHIVEALFLAPEVDFNLDRHLLLKSPECLLVGG